MAVEEWRPVEGYPLHEISSWGHVRSLRLGRLLKPETTNRGYLRVQLKNRGPHIHVHQLVLAAFIGRCPPGHETNHKNGHKTDCRLDNLEYMTPSENNKHAYDVLGKTSQKGSKHGRSKLVEGDVCRIRWLHERGVKQVELCRMYRQSPANVSLIVNRKIWRHI